MSRPGTLSPRDLLALYATRKRSIRSRLRDFKNVSQHEYFYELMYCLMTPQSSAVNAGKAVDLLRQCEFERADIDPEPILHRKEAYISS